MAVASAPSTVRVDEAHSSRPIIDLFTDRFKRIGRSEWGSRFERGLVRTSGRPLRPDERLPSGTVVEYFREVATEPEVDTRFLTVAEDPEFLVVDKPSGLPTVPSGNYINRNLSTLLGEGRPGQYLSHVHRLDKDTAGLVLFAKSIQAAAFFFRQFRAGNVRKTYHALVSKWQRPVPFDISEPILRDRPGGNPLLSRVGPGGEPSLTRVSGAEAIHDGWLLVLSPMTGRQHQLRVHLSHLGSPILGDVLYGPKQTGIIPLPPLQLLCKELMFTHPVTGAEVRVVSPRELPLG